MVCRIGVGFFTVYGPRGRPDMTPSLFVDKMRHGAPITLFNGCSVYRDWTYVSDIVAGVSGVLLVISLLRCLIWEFGSSRIDRICAGTQQMMD
jgi:nucleoside-diphosphate-sugar epimerase